LAGQAARKVCTNLGIFPSTVRLQRGLIWLTAISVDWGPWNMSEENEDVQSSEKIPTMQRILDNPFILLFIGVVFPSVFYVIWGIIEIVNIPLAP
jgi:hypothetical protein